MKIAAVIAEYNPFHNGHLYQLRSLRSELCVDYIIVVISGDFTQRGIPAIVDKYSRTRMALENGADLVFELPAYFALGSAAYFAEGAVSLLDKLGVVDVLHFGSECGDIAQLTKYAQILAYETPDYKRLLNQYLKQGLSYPTAKSKAFQQVLIHEKILAAESDCNLPSIKAINTATPDYHLLLNNTINTVATDRQCSAQILAQPNNNLAMEYIKALLLRKSTILPATITRKGSGYNNNTLTSGIFASADALRRALLDLQHNTANINTIREYLPETVYNDLKKQLATTAGSLLFTDDFSEILHYKLIYEQQHNRAKGKRCFASFYDINSQLSNTLYNHLPDFYKISDFARSCKSKNLTYTHISRCLMHILLDMKQDIIDELKEHDYSQYARLLGFRDAGKPVLKAIKANASIPLITKPAKALKELNDIARASFCADIYASTVYQNVKFHKMTHMSSYNKLNTVSNELKRQIMKLP